MRPPRARANSNRKPVRPKSGFAPPRVMVMYGVRPPGQKTIGVPLKESAVGPAEDEQLDPVAEKPADDTPYMDTKGKKAPEGGK